ncbi:8092_t:CDS:10, partial [Paraglomus brasilianum]
MAAINLRNYVTTHWSSRGDKEDFIGPEPGEEAKVIVRELMFNGLSDPSHKIRVACAYVTSKIAHDDWPEYWPNLLDLLNSNLKTGSPDQVHGAMRVLAEFIKYDITDIQFPQIATTMLPELLKILQADKVYSCRTRGRVAAVFKQSLEILLMLKEEHPEVINSFLKPIIPEWIQTFVNILREALPANQESEYEEYALKLDVIKCLNFLTKNFAKLLSPYLVSLLELIWTDIYVRESGEGVNFCQDSDGGVIGFEYLLYAQFEFVGLSIRKKTTGVLFAGTNDNGAFLNEVLWILIHYMQITEEQADAWINDANQFIADEDEETYNYTVRVAAQDLLSILLDKYPERTFHALTVSVQRHLDESNSARAAKDPTWWKIQEACLNAVGFLASDLVAAIKENDPNINFDIMGLFNHVVIGHLSCSDLPFLQGRALVFGGQFASILPPELASQYVAGAVSALQQSVAIPVRVSALQALKNFCLQLDKEYVKPYQSDIIEGVANLFSHASEDSLVLVLEIIEQVIKIDPVVTAQYEQVLGPLIIDIWEKHPTDVIIEPVVVDLFETLANNSTAYSTFQARALPHIAKAIAEPPESGVAASAIEVVSRFIKAGPSPLPNEYVQYVFPPLIRLLLSTEDREILQNGQSCLKYFVQKDCLALAQWTDANGKTGLDYIIQFIARLLQPAEEEGAALFVGTLIVKLIQKAGDKIVPVLGELLQAVAMKLESAKTATFIQSMVIVFAHLILTQLETVVNFLSNLNINGKNGLEILLSMWFENYECFQGYYSQRVSAIALTKLFLSGDPRVLNVQVQGDLIVTNTNRIMTRSRARQNPDQYTIVPASVRIIKLLMSDLQNESAAEPQRLDVEDEEEVEGGESVDDDGEWEDVDESSPFAPQEDYVVLADYLNRDVDFDDIESDAELREDPIYQTNLK